MVGMLEFIILVFSIFCMNLVLINYAKVVSRCWTVPNALSILIIEIIMWAFNFSLCAKWITLSYFVPDTIPLLLSYTLLFCKYAFCIMYRYVYVYILMYRYVCICTLLYVWVIFYLGFLIYVHMNIGLIISLCHCFLILEYDHKSIQ